MVAGAESRADVAGDAVVGGAEVGATVVGGAEVGAVVLVGATVIVGA